MYLSLSYITALVIDKRLFFSFLIHLLYSLLFHSANSYQDFAIVFDLPPKI